MDQWTLSGADLVRFWHQYFGWQPTIAQLAWSIVMLAVGRLILWVWKARPPRGELAYWFAGVPIMLVLLAGLTYATRGQRGVAPDAFAPNMTGTIDRINLIIGAQCVGTSGAPPLGASDIAIFIIADVRNSGGDSIADNWGLTVIFPESLGSVDAERLAMPDKVTVQDNSGHAMVYGNKDALYSKTLDQPVKRGSMVRGVLWFRVRDISLDQFQKPGTAYVLTFEDISKTSHTISFLWPLKPNPDWGYIPGLLMEQPTAPQPVSTPSAKAVS